MSTLAADIQFAEASGEFTSRAPLLRYGAAINPEATVSKFVAAAESAGYNPKTAAACFYASHTFDRDNHST